MTYKIYLQLFKGGIGIVGGFSGVEYIRWCWKILGQPKRTLSNIWSFSQIIGNGLCWEVFSNTQ